jgi:hypothetical protein
LDFKVAQERLGYFRNQDGSFSEFTYLDGDILIGAGFGLRSIFLGLPFGYDIGHMIELDSARTLFITLRSE